jgi:hypothetical protein
MPCSFDSVRAIFHDQLGPPETSGDRWAVWACYPYKGRAELTLRERGADCVAQFDGDWGKFLDDLSGIRFAVIPHDETARWLVNRMATSGVCPARAPDDRRVA